MQCVARVFSADQAERIADMYRMKGYDVEIKQNKRGMMRIYEVWATKKSEGRFLK